MAKKSTGKRVGGFVQLSDAEKLVVMKQAKKEFDAIPAKARETVVAVIDAHFMKVGYKPLVRLLRGKSIEDALSRWGKAES